MVEGGTTITREKDVQAINNLKYIKLKLKEWNNKIFGNIIQEKKD